MSRTASFAAISRTAFFTVSLIGSSRVSRTISSAVSCTTPFAVVRLSASTARPSCLYRLRERRRLGAHLQHGSGTCVPREMKCVAPEPLDAARCRGRRRRVRWERWSSGIEAILRSAVVKWRRREEDRGASDPRGVMLETQPISWDLHTSQQDFAP